MSIIDLRLLTRWELKNVKTLRLRHLESGDEALDRVVFIGKAVCIDKILIDADRIAAQSNLFFDP